jgi:hypothetical protein
MPVTLHQTQALTMPPLKKYVVKTLVDESPVYERIPFENQDQLSQIVPYISNIKAPSMRNLNQAGSEALADFAQVANALSIYDIDIPLDPVILMQKNMIQDPRQAQIDAQTKAFAYQLVEDYINSVAVSNNGKFDGLFTQLDSNPRFNGQVVNASANTAEVVLAPGTVTDAQAHGFLYNLNNLRRKVAPVVKPDATNNLCFISNSIYILQFGAILRQLKLLDYNRDQFDRQVYMYDGTPFLDAGFTPEGAVSGSDPSAGTKGNWVIGYDSYAPSTANGANAYDKTTPLACVHFGKDYAMGTQMQGLMVKDRERDTSPYYRVIQIRWVVNPATMWQRRSAAWLVGYNLSGTTS